MRVIALGLAAAAALALPTTSATASAECVDVTIYTAVCVEYTCRDHHCINRSYDAVYTTCEHPMPTTTCRRIPLRFGTY